MSLKTRRGLLAAVLFGSPAMALAAMPVAVRPELLSQTTEIRVRRSRRFRTRRARATVPRR